MMRILVCGGRNFNDYELLKHTLNGFFKKGDILIHGGAKGADSMASLWALGNNIEQEVFNADWETHGKSAGYIRNTKMLNDGKPDLVIAFKGGAGTNMMKRIARNAGVSVMEIF